MAHKVETMFSGGGQLPWHGMGTVVEGALTAKEAIAAAGLDWEVEMTPLEARLEGARRPTRLPIPGHFAVLRSSDRRALGVVKGRYTPLQNHEAFSFLDPVVSRKEAVYVTSGSLDGGRCIWLLAQLPGDIVVRKQDVSKRYILLTNRHDGTGAVAIKMTPCRVVCANTLALALEGGALVVRHTSSVLDRVRQAHEALGLTSKHYEELHARLNALARTRLRPPALRAYFERTLLSAGPTGTSERRRAQIIGTLEALHETGMGADIARGTVWGALNAVTEYVDHHARYQHPESRLQNIWLRGAGHGLKQEALRNALAWIR